MLFDNRPKVKEKPKTGDVIEVTEQDIKAGWQEEPEACMVAQAMMRQYGGTWSVFGDEVEFAVPDEPAAPGAWRVGKFALPNRAGRMIEKFDDGRPVKPFSFKLGKWRPL